MKRVFGLFEAGFDATYLIAVNLIGFTLFFTGADDGVRVLCGIMALVLGVGDCFHLIPRIAAIITGREDAFRPALGRGKQVTSITITVFYLLLWQLGRIVYQSTTMGFVDYLVWLLVVTRIALCLLPQNRWQEGYSPVIWAIWRNIPFFLLGAVVACRFLLEQNSLPAFHLMWLAILLSFAFYLPVVLWSNSNPKIGILMLPKTCTYLWMLIMFL